MMRITTHLIYTGLTRPPMWLGITLDYLFCCFLLVYGLFMLTANPLLLLCYLPLHIFGWVVCRYDPNFFRVILSVASCPRVANFKLWGCQSYEPY